MNAVSPSRRVVRARARPPSKPMRRSVVSVSASVLVLGGGDRLAVAGPRVLPRDALAPVVHARLALHVHLDAAVDAAHRAQQDVVGVVVGRRAPVRVRALVVVVPRPDEQHVADDDPARARAPRRLEDHRPRQVALAGGHRGVDRGEPEGPGVAVEHRAEDRRAVEARQAQPLDVAARRHERADLAVGEERVVRDRREGASAQWDVADDVAHGGRTVLARRGRGLRPVGQAPRTSRAGDACSVLCGPCRR